MTDLVEFPNAIEAKWSSGNETLATSGGIFLEGDDWDEWEGRLAVATLKNRSLRVFEFTGDGDLVSEVVVPELDDKYGRLRTPMLGPDGALYLTTSNGDGKDWILRVVPSQPPAFPAENQTLQVAENSSSATVIATVTAIDPDGDPLTYALSGPDAAAFSIAGGAVGQVRANVAFDYEARRSYEVIVTASDPYDLSDGIALTIAVTNVDEAGTVTLSGRADVDQELTAMLSDPDGRPSGITWQWARSNNRSDWTVIAGEASERYTPVAGDVGSYLRVTATYTDGHGPGKISQAVTAQPVRITWVAHLVLTPASIRENGGSGTITARLSRTSSETTTVVVAATPVSPAVAGDFRLSANKTLTIDAGQTNREDSDHGHSRS